jgi:surface antigen
VSTLTRIGAAVAAVLAVSAAPASASAVSLTAATRSVRAGGHSELQVRLSGAAERCRLQFVYGRGVRSLKWISATRAMLTWSWQVPGDARSARWTVRAACTRGQTATTLQVRGRRNGQLAVARTVTVTQRGPMLETSPAAPVNNAAPLVSGTATDGQTLSATTGVWTPSALAYAYQWQRDSGTGFTNIPGATGSTYTLTSADVGSSVHVVVTATDVSGSASATSADVGPVAAAGAGLNPGHAYTCSSGGQDYDGPGCWAGWNNFAQFPYGGCEYWAYSQRPDIANADPGLDWTASNWAANAAAEGYSVSTQVLSTLPGGGTSITLSSPPQVGDIAVDESGGGHVAYVVGVSTDQYGNVYVTVTEMNHVSAAYPNGDPNPETNTYPVGGFDAYIHQRGAGAVAHSTPAPVSPASVFKAAVFAQAAGALPVIEPRRTWQRPSTILASGTT